MALKGITGLFKNTAKSGQVYYSGKARERIVIEPGDKLLMFDGKEQGTEGKPHFSLSVDKPDDGDAPF